ncbi:hypothetical protein ACOZ38_19910 [Sphaerisporangium viridialbum]|uniref:hypothetical protein n=1 Tax=Sphaerisporangium viridialbum TaxID=46189 RepID=UPI003C70624A
MNLDRWIAIGGAVIAAVGMIVAWRALVQARRSANAADRSAVAAEKSATEAAALSEIEGERRKDEREETHRSLHPTQQTAIVTSLDGPTGAKNLFGTIEVDRPVRAHATAILANGAMAPISLPVLLLPKRGYRFHIEQWPDDRKAPATDEVLFKFWPPVAAVDGDDWTCSCGRPTIPGDGSKAHWWVRLPVSYKQRPKAHGF